MSIKYVQSCGLGALALLVCTCASVGTPKGGPKDVNPPQLLYSDPADLSLNNSKKRIEITFDELISLKSPSEKVLISPPQVDPPEVKTIAKKAVVVFSDSLKTNTTYTIDFTDAIVDFNEGNKFGDYALTFSTGNQIDSLRISGTLIDASNLNPMSGFLVGTHSNRADSAFRKNPFDRVSRSSSKGQFTVKGLPNGSFNVFGLNDKNRSYKFDSPDESIAFLDSSLVPYVDFCEKFDTIWKDSTTVDSIRIRTVSCFKPDDILLRCFKEDYGRQLLTRKERNPRNRIRLTFGYRSETLPKVELLDTVCHDWYKLEWNPTRDSLTYWIKDTALIARDTIRLKTTYQKTDSLNRLVWTTDTLSFISRTFRGANLTAQKKETDKKKTAVKTIPHLSINSGISGTMEINSRPYIQFSEPLKDVSVKSWHLYVKEDTVWKDASFKIVQDSQRIRLYYLDIPWDFDREYKFEMDSGMVQGLYGISNNTFSQTFQVRAKDEYSRLTVTVLGMEGKGFVELLNNSDQTVRRLPLKNQTVDFLYLLPSTYYLRAVQDKNGNGVWDTGDYAHKLQPEMVFYNPKSFSLRENWDVEEQWNIHDFPLLEQKPKELIPKNTKP